MPDDQREISPTPHITPLTPAAPTQSFHFLLATISPLHPSNPKRLFLRHELAFIYMRGSVAPSLLHTPERGPCFSGTSPHAFPKVPTWGLVWGNRLASQSWKYRPRARLAGCSIRSLEAMPWRRSWAVMPWWWLINVLTMDDNVRFSTDMPLSREDTRYPL